MQKFFYRVELMKKINIMFFLPILQSMFDTSAFYCYTN